MRNILIWCAGASPELLSECPEIDTLRQKIIGTVVFFTGLIAGVGAFYAFYSTSKSYSISIVGALIWASFILTLDRLVISSICPIKRGEIYALTSWQALPRIALAVLIGITIAKPIELYIFKEEILSAQIKSHEETIKKREKDDQARIQSWWDAASSVCAKRVGRSRLDNLQSRISSIDSQIESTINGTDGRGPTCRRHCEDLIKQKDRLMREHESALSIWNSCVNKEHDELSKKNEIQNSNLQKSRIDSDEAANSQSLLSQYRTLQNIAEHDPHVRHASIFISILFIFFEIAPVLTKLFSGVSGYELAVLRKRLEAIQKADEQVVKTQTIQERRKAEHERDAAIFREEIENAKTMHRELDQQIRENTTERISNIFSSIIGAAIIDHRPMSELDSMLIHVARNKLYRSVRLDPYSHDGVFSETLFSTRDYRNDNSGPASRAEWDNSGLPFISTANSSPHNTDPRPTEAPNTGSRSSEASTKSSKSKVNSPIQKYRESFIKKAIESFASKTPEYFSSIFLDFPKYLATFSGALTLLFSILGQAAVTALPFLVVFFFMMWRKFNAKNLAKNTWWTK